MTNWDDERTGPRPQTSPPRFELVEACWYAQGSTGKTVSCGIYLTDDPGFEVRAGYTDEDLLYSQRVSTIELARELAATWRQAAIDKGFVELHMM